MLNTTACKWKTRSQILTMCNNINACKLGLKTFCSCGQTKWGPAPESQVTPKLPEVLQICKDHQIAPFVRIAFKFPQRSPMVPQFITRNAPKETWSAPTEHHNKDNFCDNSSKAIKCPKLKLGVQVQSDTRIMPLIFDANKMTVKDQHKK